MEKPFGTDLPSARRAERRPSTSVFDDDQVFRIDHFLGKEAAQNILAFRFANGLFEPIWNREHIDHVQIDVPETLVGRGPGRLLRADRAPSGTWWSPTSSRSWPSWPWSRRPRSSPGAISEEKNKVFRSMQPHRPDPGGAGPVRGLPLERRAWHPDSDTETFVALRCEIDNWRWAGVPFYLRTGKQMAEGARIVSIAFREPPKSMFPPGLGRGRPRSRPPDLRPGRRVQAVALLLRQAARARA